MALLQISEPGQSTAPHQHRLAVGIDLGTTNSLVASVRSGDVQTMPDENGEHLLPSVVRYLEDDVEVGQIAAQHAITDPMNTIVSVKRFMGQQYMAVMYILSSFSCVYLPQAARTSNWFVSLLRILSRAPLASSTSADLVTTTSSTSFTLVLECIARMMSLNTWK